MKLKLSAEFEEAIVDALGQIPEKGLRRIVKTTPGQMLVNGAIAGHTKL